MAVRLLSAAFDPWQELAAYQAGQPGLAGKHGATAIFVGHMRDFNQGAAVRAMTLEHYPSMTQKQIERIGEQAAGRWELLDLLVIHRYGALVPGDPIVLVAVWATHREAAFGACRYVIDELKTHAPFWKQEQTSSGQRWVAPETDG